MHKIIFVIVGTVSLLLGVLGIFLPILPTTPFLLLTAFCYMRGSHTLYDKLMQHERLGAYIRNFQEQKAIPFRVKVISITVLWLTIICSVFFFLENILLRMLLVTIAIGVTVHILSYRTLGKSLSEDYNRAGKKNAK